ncbi:transmembrane anchor protein [Denitromonas ohlonensis]|uniref:Transmembrane anchor protein n=2 Tax=Denitromonas TaxID=139331 RepID=A0A557SJ49_9RHOO|nr:transmembrane anchor protein [Denitromonas ohlonensis]TVO69334.1 transmembrane anchor protein [Denitromonas ohlonensis]TVO77434.1 transmembrane anchor protein [Denitromonas ohlonensis]
MYNTNLPTRAELPTSGQLLRSTGLAALIAAGLLITTVLPAEYGIDPTGVGRTLGLTQMGTIKTSLATEAQAGEVGHAPAPAPVVATAPSAPAVVDHGHDHGHAADGGHSHDAAPATTPVAGTQPQAAPAAAEPVREHTVTVSLKPGQAAEIKLSMDKGAAVRYSWSASGGGVNYDTHGDPVNAPKGFYHGYGKGRNETAQKGTLQAAFDGKHGWFWRNRSGGDVTVTLKTEGDYGQIERVL